MERVTYAGPNGAEGLSMEPSVGVEGLQRACLGVGEKRQKRMKIIEKLTGIDKKPGRVDGQVGPRVTTPKQPLFSTSTFLSPSCLPFFYI